MEYSCLACAPVFRGTCKSSVNMARASIGIDVRLFTTDSARPHVPASVCIWFDTDGEDYWEATRACACVFTSNADFATQLSSQRGFEAAVYVPQPPTAAEEVKVAAFLETFVRCERYVATEMLRRACFRTLSSDLL